MTTALLKFTQGTTVGANGRALVVAIGATPVTIENSDDTGVASYKIELLYAPPDSPTYVVVPNTPHVLATDNGTPTATLDVSALAVYGCYRIRLTVWPQANQVGVPDVDIRNVAVVTPTYKLVLPPYQKFPDPIALEGTGSKPDELNFLGQTWGWSGPGYDAVNYPWRLVNEALKLCDSIGTGTSIPSANYAGSYLYWSGTAWTYTNTPISSNHLGAVPIADDTGTGSLATFPNDANPGGTSIYDDYGYWVLGTLGPGTHPAAIGIRPNHMTPVDGSGSIYFVQDTGSGLRVMSSTSSAPSDGQVLSWGSPYSNQPNWSNFLDVIPDGYYAWDILYWNGTVWEIKNLFDEILQYTTDALVRSDVQGSVNQFPSGHSVLQSDGSTSGGVWRAFLRGMKAVTFTEEYAAGTLTGTNTVDVDVNAYNKQRVVLNGAGTINFTNSLGEPTNCILYVEWGTGGTPTFTGGGSASGVTAPSGILDISNTADSIIGVYFDGTLYHLTSSTEHTGPVTTNMV